jgi:hypothetical protein
MLSLSSNKLKYVKKVAANGLNRRCFARYI